MREDEVVVGELHPEVDLLERELFGESAEPAPVAGRRFAYS